MYFVWNVFLIIVSSFRDDLYKLLIDEEKTANRFKFVVSK